MATRVETDSLGPVQVPAEALWGAQTQRAIENFPISGLRQSPDYLAASALVKQAAAEVQRVRWPVGGPTGDRPLPPPPPEIVSGAGTTSSSSIPSRPAPRHLAQYECQRGHRQSGQ
jgi:hypothetical protein